MKRLLGFVILAPAFVLAWATGAVADPTFCPPNLVSATVDDVVVTDGLCFVGSSTINGNIQVEPSGALTINTANVTGDVVVDGGDTLQMFSTTVGGSVIVSETKGLDKTTPHVMRWNLIAGDLQFNENRLRNIWPNINSIQDNNVGGSLQVNENTGRGVLWIVDNLIGGDLLCQENRIDDLVVNGNTFGGVAVGQCAP
jgi:hypothetical protein